MATRVQPPRKSKTTAIIQTKKDLEDLERDEQSLTDESDDDDFQPISREKTMSGTNDIDEDDTSDQSSTTSSEEISPRMKQPSKTKEESDTNLSSEV